MIYEREEKFAGLRLRLTPVRGREGEHPPHRIAPKGTLHRPPPELCTFHEKNISTKLDWYLGAIFYLRDYPLQIYMKLVAVCFCLWLHHPPPTNIYSCGGYWYIPLAYLLATISNNIRDYKYTFIVIFSSISISISNNIRDYKHIHLL